MSWLGDIARDFGGVIAGGFGLAGGKMSSDASKENTQAQINWAREERAANESMQRQFARHGLSWKVADAQESGLHPLYAIGGAGAAFTPTTSQINFDNGGEHMGRALAQAGQDIGRSVSATETPEQRQMRMVQMRLAESQANRNDAESAVAWNQVMRDYQGNQAQPGMPTSAVVHRDNANVVVNPIRQHPLTIDHVELQPDPQGSVRSSNPGIRSATNALMSEYTSPTGLKILLPGNGQGSASESLESVAESHALLAWVISENVAHYGDDWLSKFARIEWPQNLQRAINAGKREAGSRSFIPEILRSKNRRGDNPVNYGR